MKWNMVLYMDGHSNPAKAYEDARRQLRAAVSCLFTRRFIHIYYCDGDIENTEGGHAFDVTTRCFATGIEYRRGYGAGINLHD